MSSGLSNVFFPWVKPVQKMFGEKPRPVGQTPAQPLAVQEKSADLAKDELLKRLAKLRRATQVSQLTEPNVKRTTLGAGGI